jgi:hypothetical protein
MESSKPLVLALQETGGTRQTQGPMRISAHRRRHFRLIADGHFRGSKTAFQTNRRRCFSVIADNMGFGASGFELRHSGRFLGGQDAHPQDHDASDSTMPASAL